jgi:glycerol-3-phosphate responsive antiterminator
MILSNDLKQLLQAYNLNAKDVLLCFAVAAGMQINDVYSILFARTNTPENELQKQSEDYLKRNPAAKILINRIKTGKKKEINQGQKDTIKKINESEKDELKTRPGIIAKLIEEVTNVAGKDAISGLQTLAKLQGFDKPDEINEEEKRFFVLPYLSNCRSCKLMQVFCELKHQEHTETT